MSKISYSMNASMGGALEMSTAIQSILNKIHTATVVKVISVESGATGAVGYVDVLPLVKQLASDGSSYSSAKIKKLPYFRLQGGMNAVIIDPQVGDLGIAIFAERDISAVKREKSEVAPASLRKYDLADGLYLGGFLNGAPKQYMHFKDGGGIKVIATGDFEVEAEGDIKMTAQGAITLNSSSTMTLADPSTITLDTPSTMITGGMTGGSGAGLARSAIVAQFNIPVIFKQLATFKSDADFDGIKFSTHKHGGVVAGGDDTSEPTG